MTVQLMSLAVPRLPMPPPLSPELPETVLLMSVSVPLLKMPPPEPAVLPETVLLVIVSVPLLKMPPPAAVNSAGPVAARHRQPVEREDVAGIHEEDPRGVVARDGHLARPRPRNPEALVDDQLARRQQDGLRRGECPGRVKGDGGVRAGLGYGLAQAARAAVIGVGDEHGAGGFVGTDVDRAADGAREADATLSVARLPRVRWSRHRLPD